MTADIPEALHAAAVDAVAEVLHDLDSQFIPTAGWEWWANEIRIVVLPLVADHYETQREPQAEAANVERDAAVAQVAHYQAENAALRDERVRLSGEWLATENRLRGQLAESRAELAALRDEIGKPATEKGYTFLDDPTTARRLDPYPRTAEYTPNCERTVHYGPWRFIHGSPSEHRACPATQESIDDCLDQWENDDTSTGETT